MLTFYLDTKSNCKHLWKSCLDHHTFFRIKTVYDKPAKLNTALVMAKKSKVVSHVSNESENFNSNGTYFRRVPAKRKMMPQISSFNGRYFKIH